MIAFRVHGVRAVVRATSPAIEAELRRDLSWFAIGDEDGNAYDVEIDARLEEPPWDDAPERARRSIVHPDFVAYDCGERFLRPEAERWVDYQGRALSRWDFARERGTLWSRDATLLHELVYLLLLSRVGEIHDRRGVHRAHALGLRVNGHGILCFLPSGGGKTTLGLAALGTPGVELLSDDTPLITRDGELLSFPARVGCVERPEGVAGEHVRRFTRRHYGTKYLVDIEAFEGRVADAAPASIVLLGERRLRGGPRIARARASQAAAELVRSVVVGHGLPQVVEYFLRWDPRDVASKARVVASRGRAASALLRRADVYRFELGRDRAANADALVGFLGAL